MLVGFAIKNGSAALPLEPDLPSTTDRDMDDGVHRTAVSESSLVDHVGNTDW